jgi:hypothetical protein
MMGSAVQPRVFLNEVAVGKSQPGSFFYVDRQPGSYEVKCSTEWASKCPISVSRNKVRYVRLTIGPGVFVGHIIPSEVPEEQALREIAPCKLLTADGANKEVLDKMKSDSAR